MPEHALEGDLAALALGSNLDTPRVQIERAAEAIDAIEGVRVLASSRIFESPPWGDTDQPWFLNAALLVNTTLSPRHLLAACQRIETALGKVVVRRWGPRAIDIDLLLHGDRTSADPELLIPHPSIRQRPFVYLPLREIAPGPHDAATWQPCLAGDEAGRGLESQTRPLPPRSSDLFPQGDLWRRRVDFALKNEDHTHALGVAIGRAAGAGLVVALTGDLGAGKTRLVRGIAEGLGLAGHVPSPTFTFCREHTGGRRPLHHWDLYRCAGPGDLESIGFFDSLESGAVLAVEWADRFPRLDEAAPGRVLGIRLVPYPDDADRRWIFVDMPGGHLGLRAAILRLAAETVPLEA